MPFFNDDEKETFARLVKTARGDNSLRVLAKEVGVSFSTIFGWESQTGDPSWESFEKFAQATGYSLIGLYCIIKKDYPSKKELFELSQHLEKSEKIELATMLLSQAQKETQLETLYGVNKK